MKNYTITEEQIKQLVESKHPKRELKEMFKDVFEHKLEVGKWYKINNEDDYLLFYQGKGNATYGFFGDNWDSNWAFDSYHEDGATLATHEEVKAALINEAKRRGFVKLPEKFKLVSGKIQSGFARGNDIFYLYNRQDALTLDGAIIFEKGKWAEVIKETELTLQQIADKFEIPVETLKIKK